MPSRQGCQNILKAFAQNTQKHSLLPTPNDHAHLSAVWRLLLSGVAVWCLLSAVCCVLPADCCLLFTLSGPLSAHLGQQSAPSGHRLLYRPLDELLRGRGEGRGVKVVVNSLAQNEGSSAQSRTTDLHFHGE